jgi:hypothetical protein
MPANARMCSYDLDRHLVITSLGPGWDEFALENGAAELLAPAPVGHPLMMYVSDATTVHLYELLFTRVSRERREVSFPIRCDGPALRRYLTVTISPKAGAGFRVNTMLVRSEARAPVQLLATSLPRRQDQLVVCGWCKKAGVGEQWVELEQAVALLGMFEGRDPPEMTHGICTTCQRFMITLLADDAELPPR